MKDSIQRHLVEACPKTGRIVGMRDPKQLPVILLPVVGFLALVWFLIRVVPKPSRAAYPCQRVAAPLAGSFLLWLAGIAGASLAFSQARAKLRQARYATAALALVVAVVGIAWTVLNLGRPAQAMPFAYPPHPANTPIGTAKGLMPGRVVWSHDPQVTDWDGTSTNVGQRWYDRINQTEATYMMQWALTGYADTTTTGTAWDAIFWHFNGGAAYQPGEKVFIKINMTTSNSPRCADAGYNWNPSSCGASWTSIGQSPQVMVALLDQLVNVVGVAQSDITIGDSTGLWVNELYNPLHDVFPNVKYMDARGTLGRTKATTSTVPLYWSTSEANGVSQDYLLQAVVDAKYVINFAILKSHELAGVTATAKNHFGSLSGGNDNPRKPDTTNYYDLHLRLPLDADAWPQRASMAQYRPLVDLNGHQGMGGKTLLYMIDGIYAGKGWSGTPSRWNVLPFKVGTTANWPASLFLSMDQVAIDSVAFDLLSLRTDWTDVLAVEGVQDYLHEMALADNPPSGTFYDPEHDGIAMASQGVHEHWNNATDKKYTRNLGTGNGIELLYNFHTAVMPPTGVTITGPATGTVNTAYIFTATVSPITATTPISYVWTPAPNSGQGTLAIVSYTWAVTGVKRISVMAQNIGGTVTDTHDITISSQVVPLTRVTISGPTAGITNTAYSFTANISPITATAPITYTWMPAPDSGQGTSSASYTWTTVGTKTITVTAQNTVNMVTDTHAITIQATLAVPETPTLYAINNPDGDGDYVVDWSDVSGATSYTLQQDNKISFSGPTMRYTGADSCYTITGQAGGTWYYRVLASNVGGNSLWSDVQTVTVTSWTYLPLVMKDG